MKKTLLLLAGVLSLAVLGGCCRRCEVEPIVQENHKLVVPPDFGTRPK